MMLTLMNRYLNLPCTATWKQLYDRHKKPETTVQFRTFNEISVVPRDRDTKIVTVAAEQALSKKVDSSVASVNAADIVFLDFYAGGGGASLGAKRAGVTKFLAFEANDEKKTLYEKNFGVNTFVQCAIGKTKESIVDKDIEKDIIQGNLEFVDAKAIAKKVQDSYNLDFKFVW